jgi:hypothetical protein
MEVLVSRWVICAGVYIKGVVCESSRKRPFFFMPARFFMSQDYSEPHMSSNEYCILISNLRISHHSFQTEKCNDFALIEVMKNGGGSPGIILRECVNILLEWV